MKRTLLISCLSLFAACAADTFDDSQASDTELATLEQSPWLDDEAPRDGGARADAAAANDDDEGPWIDPPLDTPTAPAPSAPTASGGYDFEENKQGWIKSGPPITNSKRSSAQRATGESSLEVTFDGAGVGTVSVANPPLRAGMRVSFRIFVPSGARLKWIQPYFQRGPGENWAWTGTWTPLAAFRQNGWTTVTVQVPSDARTFGALGVQFETAGEFRGHVYIDDVRF